MVIAIHKGGGVATGGWVTGGKLLIINTCPDKSVKKQLEKKKTKQSEVVRTTAAQCNVPSTGALLQQADALSPPSPANDTSFSILQRFPSFLISKFFLIFISF